MKLIRYQGVRYVFSAALIGILIVILIAAAYGYKTSEHTKIKKCQSATNKPLCYHGLIDNELKRSGISAALDTLANIYVSDPDFSESCHSNTHEIGKAAYRKFSATGQIELSPNVSYCGFGFYHGFMEALTAETNDYTEIGKLCTYADQKAPFPRGVAERACYHGVGHGTVDGSDPRMWGDVEAMIRPALKECDRISTSPVERKFCYGGAFNGIGDLAQKEKYRLNYDKNPFEICESGSYTVVQKEACHVQLNQYVAWMYGGNFEKVVKAAASVADPYYRAYAVYGAWAAVKSMNTRDDDGIAHIVQSACATLSDPYDSICMHGVVLGVLVYGTPAREPQDALGLCKNQGLDDKLRTQCFKTLSESIVTRYPPALAVGICSEIPAQYKTTYCTVDFEEAQQSTPREFDASSFAIKNRR